MRERWQHRLKTVWDSSEKEERLENTRTVLDLILAWNRRSDADSEGIEGLFYTWTADELQAVLGDDFELLARTYGVTDEGNVPDGCGVVNLHNPGPLYPKEAS